MNNKIFISGKITGDPSYPQKFEAAEVVIKRPYFFDRHGVKIAQRKGRFGYIVVNPTDLTFMCLPLAEFPWIVCMAVSISHMLCRSTVYMIHDWKKSRGAKMEHGLAKFFKKHIIYQKNDDE